MALRTGELDGVVWCGITEAYTVGWANATKYFLTNNISGAWIGSFLANTKSWEKVPPHLQELFRLCMDSSHYYRQYWYWAGEANLRVNGGKLKLTTIPAEEWKSIEDGALKFWDEVVAKGEGEHGCAYDEAHPPLHTLCRQTQRIRRRGRDVSAFGDNGDVAVFDIYKCDTPSGDMGYGNVAVYDGCVLHLGGASSLKHGIHVCMDFVYERWKARTKAMVDLFTVFFLFFYLYIMIRGGWDSSMFALEFDQRNHSVWKPPMAPVKITMTLGMALMFLQAVAELLKDFCRAIGRKY